VPLVPGVGGYYTPTSCQLKLPDKLLKPQKLFQGKDSPLEGRALPFPFKE